jgi:Zn-dependent protease/predicted transcriptional regulator
MQWSFPILRLGETEVRIHLTFFLLLLWIGLAHYQVGGSAAALDGVVFIVAVFGCVVLHELGHTLAARRYGIHTPRITLLPIGGVAQMEKMPDNPWEEVVVAIAGPLVNVAIAGVLIFGFGVAVNEQALASMESPGSSFWSRLAAVNIMLVVFNLIPAFPMDGGRVFRALLSTRMSRKRATDLAARTGQLTAFAFGFLGLVSGNALLVFVAIFVYLAAGGEAQAVSLQELARRIRTRDVMITTFQTLDIGASLGDAAEALLRTTQHEFPIIDGAGKLRGVLTREALVAGLEKGGRSAPVIEAMQREIPVVSESVPLDKVLEALQHSGAPVVGVTSPSGALSGYIDRENIVELLMVGTVFEKKHRN